MHSVLKKFRFHCGLSQNIEYRFLCYTGYLVNQCVGNRFGSANPKLPVLLPQPLPLDNHKSVPYVCESISGKQLFSLKGQNKKCPMGSLSRSAFKVYMRQWDKQLSMCDQANAQLKNCDPPSPAPDRKSTSSLCIDRLRPFLLDKVSDCETKVWKVRESIRMRRKTTGDGGETFLRALRSTAYFVAWHMLET